MPNLRHVKLLRRDGHQLIRIPAEFELPGQEAIMYRDGDRVVIEPARKRGLLALLETMKPFDGDFPKIDDQPPAPEKLF
ncbi:MAG: antitoxin VapB [Bradyrhizobium sp.]|jgi:antitoxin VapB|nr:antitoxin VapB [Bradyrhizobium sp.]